MSKGLTPNPHVNRILDKLNNSRRIEGKSEITKSTLSEYKESKVMFPEKVPFCSLHKRIPSGVIDKAYLAQKPSLFELIKLKMMSLNYQFFK